eukprot:1039184-Amphidinium_carterae.1
MVIRSGRTYERDRTSLHCTIVNVQEVKRQILAGGFTKVTLRSDGEHPCLALKARVGEELRREGVE